MFTELQQFLENSDLNMTISKQGEVIIVSTIPKLKGEDQPEIKPLIIRGTAEELDAGFIAAVQQKLPAVAGLKIDAEAFDASVNEAKEGRYIGVDGVACVVKSVQRSKTVSEILMML